MSRKVDKLQADIEKRIAEIKAGQLDRACMVEKALNAFEKNIRVRNVSDYIALSSHQRRLLGIVDNKSETTHNIIVRIKNTAKE